MMMMVCVCVCVCVLNILFASVNCVQCMWVCVSVCECAVCGWCQATKTTIAMGAACVSVCWFQAVLDVLDVLSLQLPFTQWVLSLVLLASTLLLGCCWVGACMYSRAAAMRTGR
jgi:hypothetical protein